MTRRVLLCVLGCALLVFAARQGRGAAGKGETAKDFSILCTVLRSARDAVISANAARSVIATLAEEAVKAPRALAQSVENMSEDAQPAVRSHVEQLAREAAPGNSSTLAKPETLATACKTPEKSTCHACIALAAKSDAEQHAAKVQAAALIAILGKHRSQEKWDEETQSNTIFTAILGGGGANTGGYNDANVGKALSGNMIWLCNKHDASGGNSCGQGGVDENCPCTPDGKTKISGKPWKKLVKSAGSSGPTDIVNNWAVVKHICLGTDNALEAALSKGNTAAGATLAAHRLNAALDAFRTALHDDGHSSPTTANKLCLGSTSTTGCDAGNSATAGACICYDKAAMTQENGYTIAWEESLRNASSQLAALAADEQSARNALAAIRRAQQAALHLTLTHQPTSHNEDTTSTRGTRTSSPQQDNAPHNTHKAQPTRTHTCNDAHPDWNAATRTCEPKTGATQQDMAKGRHTTAGFVALAARLFGHK
ncbi:hypothetical protein TRVL_04430 [Trypanosoma vivax]|nr:hypothetical protein TRVL_04430 [Trypanosoma vivax]